MSESKKGGIFSRRGLLGIGWFSFIVSMVGPALANIRFLFPNAVYEPPSRVKLGKPEEYARGSATFVEDQRFYLFRDGEGFRAISAVCTHLRCTINSFGPADAEYGEPHAHCPCHGSVFAQKDGRVLKGPAPVALEIYEVGLAPDGRLVVDTARRVDAGFRFRV